MRNTHARRLAELGAAARSARAEADRLAAARTAAESAREQGLTNGFRTIVNTGHIARQDVMHIHVHVLGGPERLGHMLPHGAQ